MGSLRSVSTVVLFLGLSVSPVYAGVAPKNPDTLIALDNSELDSVDPAWANVYLTMNLVANIYEPLIALKGGSIAEFEPRLATAVPSRENGLISSDCRVYRFPIRKGVKFHDGTGMAPADVRYSLLRFLLTDPLDSPAGKLLREVLGTYSTRGRDGRLKSDMFRRADRAVRVEGDSLVVTLEQPSGTFLANVAAAPVVMSRRWAAAQGAWDGSGSTWARYNNPRREENPLQEKENGTGPFRLERIDRVGRAVHLARFDGYWRAPARLKRVVVKAVEEFSTRKLMLQAGDADVIVAGNSDLSQLQGIEGVEVISGLKLFEINPMVYFNMDVSTTANPFIGSGRLDGKGIPPDFFSDRDVRQGFAYAMDYDSLVRDFLRGRGEKARSIIPKGVPGYDDQAPAYRFDPEKARAHFQKAFGGRVWEHGFHLVLSYVSKDIPCQILKKEVEALNPKFKIDARRLEWYAYSEHFHHHRLPLWFASVDSNSPNPNDFAYYLLHSESLRLGYNNPEADRLIEKAATSADPVERAALYRRIQRIAFEDVPVIPVAQQETSRVQRSWVKGYVFNPAYPGAPHRSDYYALWKE